ncbi:MAG TPA: DapH/DapD/GlmU-related protein [Pseudomonadales bacterium]|jgi:2,3,4,5-tetrahydropyridine-2-carboxylate N-succinyltransferase
MSGIFAFAVGTVRRNTAGAPLDFYFPAPVINPEPDLAAQIEGSFSSGAHEVGPAELARFAKAVGDSAMARLLSSLAETDRAMTAVRLDADEPIDSSATAYLKLHLLSHRMALPNTLNLDGIFAHLPNVAWTDRGPIDPEELAAAQLQARLAGGHIEVLAVDKFPRMTNYIVPSGVRIADASRIRLGAYLGDGTTVMHEGQINFNAGALGPNMVEGRISQGVILGEHSDLGGSASTMGTLSGGGEITISIGKHCLIGANAGTGIPLGDRCTIEAGLYITAGTPVTLIDETGEDVRTMKARELAGGSDLLFIRNGRSGRIECRSNRKAIELNEQLHAHN